MQAPFTRFPQPVVCSICNKQYKDVHEHIEHMTSVHQMKASFRCSTCGEIFPSKVAVEAHLATHAATESTSQNAGACAGGSSKSPASSAINLSSTNNNVTRSACDAENVLALDIEEDEDEEGNDDLLKEVYNCACERAYLSRMSFEVHQKVCPVKLQQQLNNSTTTPTSTVSRSQESSNINHTTRSGEIVTRRLQSRGRSLGSLDSLGIEKIGTDASNCRKMVEAIHSDGDTNCKACLKPMKGFISLFNHLSRRNECKEFYDNLVSGHGLDEDVSPTVFRERNRFSLETSSDRGNNNNNSLSKSIDSLLHTKRALSTANTSGASATSSPVTVGSSGTSTSGNTTNSGSTSDSKGGGGVGVSYNPAFTDLGPDDIIIAPADELIRRAYLVRNRVQCPRCTKIFGGKTPAVAYNNHRRNKHCPATQATVPYLKAKFNKNKDKQQNPQVSDAPTISSTSNNPTPSQESESKLPDQAQVRYYCKLCPNRDIKNRVSLGVHLTTYHGLPPVNIGSTTDGILLRCQTCSQTYNSKYFYNMHRYDCDLTSPYIGILEPDKPDSEDLAATESKNAIVESEEEATAHLPAPPPSIMAPPIQSISPTPTSPQTQSTNRQQSSNSSPSSSESTPSPITMSSSPSLPKIQTSFNNPPRGSAASNAYFGSNYTCTLCHKKGFPGPNAVRIHQKYQCVKRPLVPPPKSPYPSPLAKPRTKSYSRPTSRNESQSGSNESRLAALLGSPNPVANSPLKGDRLSELNRVNESGLLMCDACGRGPYNSQYYLLEHKRQYCQVGKNQRNVSSPSNSSSSKSIDIESACEQTSKSSKPKDLSQRIVPPSSSTSNNNNLVRPVPQKANRSNDICLIISNNMVTNGSFNNESKSKNATNNNNTPRKSHINKNPTNNNNNNKEPPNYVDLDMNPENVPPGESDNVLECTECGFQESSVFKFVRHRLKHFSDKPEDARNYACYACEICKGKIVFSQLPRIRQHLYHHLKVYNALNKKDSPPKERKKRNYPFDDESDAEDSMITCPYCRACQFSDASGLSDHIKNVCPYRFRCIKCDQTFLTKTSLEDHKMTCLDEVGLRSNSKANISCHHCGLKFTSKQRAFFHEQACHKVYNADVSQRVEELIERASTCAICGLRAKNYIVKAKHEVKCLEMALGSLGIKFLHFENVEDIDSDSSIVNGKSIDQSSLISANGEAVEDERMEGVEEEEEDAEDDIEDNVCELMVKLSEEEFDESLRKQHGITKDVKVLLDRLPLDCNDEIDEENEAEEDDNEDMEEDAEEEVEEEGEYDEYDEDFGVDEFLDDDNDSKLESLKKMFDKLLAQLIPDGEVLNSLLNEKPVDEALISILQKMNSNHLTKRYPHSNYINNFRSNIQTFLQLSIAKETLENVSVGTKLVDEVVTNLLNIN